MCYRLFNSSVINIYIVYCTQEAFYIDVNRASFINTLAIGAVFL